MHAMKFLNKAIYLICALFREIAAKRAKNLARVAILKDQKTSTLKSLADDTAAVLDDYVLTGAGSATAALETAWVVLALPKRCPHACGGAAAVLLVSIQALLTSGVRQPTTSTKSDTGSARA